MPAVTTTAVSAVCPKCGTVQKSGRSSCCGRGGAWFGRCGSVGNTNFEHSWYDGIQACDSRQGKAVVGQQLRAFHLGSGASPNNGSMRMSSRIPVAAGHKARITLADTSTAVLPTEAVTALSNTSIVLRQSEYQSELSDSSELSVQIPSAGVHITVRKRVLLLSVCATVLAIFIWY